MIRSECLVDFLISCGFKDWKELSINCAKQYDIEKQVDLDNEKARQDRIKRMFPK
jgi:hypothetical protein